MSEHNDPATDSLFHRLNALSCCCKVCGAVVPNSTEARDAHLNGAEFSPDPIVRAKHGALFGASPSSQERTNTE